MSVVFSNHPVQLLGNGSALPGPAINNEQLFTHLARFASSKNVRIARALAHRLGIRSRHISRDLTGSHSGTRPGMGARELCVSALRSACSIQGINVSALDYLVGHTATPCTLLPSNTAWVAEDVGFDGSFLELRQACSGFANALQICAAMIASQTIKQVAIVGSETGSPYFSLTDEFLDVGQLINFVQMGDGAGAIVIGPSDDSDCATISDIFTGQIGVGKAPGISILGGGSDSPHCKHGMPVFSHDGKNVRKQGAALFHAGIEAILTRGYGLADFDWILPHQVNGRIAQAFHKELGIDSRKIVVTADQVGNLGSAAIWVGFDNLLRSGKLARGDKVLVLGAEASKYIYGGFVYIH